MKAAFKYLLIWLLINTVASVVTLFVGYYVGAIAGHPFEGIEAMLEHPWVTAIIMLLTDLLVVYIFWKRKYTRLDYSYGYTFGQTFSNKKLYLWAAVSAVGLLVFDLMAGFYLPIPEDPEVGETLWQMMNNPIGFITVCLTGPLAEEIICRGAIERRLLEKNWNPWFAIVISAALFAAAHMNWAQGVTALVIGIFMGWVYYRTRSIWPTVLVHVVNNTVASLLVLVSPETMMDESYTVPLIVGIPLIVVSIVIIAIAAKHIATLTKDRTPIPTREPEILPPPLPIGVEPPAYATQDMEPSAPSETV